MSRAVFSILVVATTATSHAGAQAPVVGESYYVRRVLERGGTSCGPADHPSCETSGRTTCTSLAFDGTTLELAADTGRSAIRFRAARAPDGSLALSSAEVTVHDMRVPIELRDGCTASVTFDDALFPDRASCLAAPSTFHATCTGTSCMRDSLASGAWVFDGDAPPLLAGDCERPIAAMYARAALMTNADYAARERTFLRFRRISTSGGILFERHGDACHAVAVSPPVASGSMRANVFSTRWRTPDGGVADQRAEYVLHALLASVTVLGESESWRSPNGIGGMGHRGYLASVGLHFGDGVVLLGHRTLYLHRSRCARTR